MARIAVILAAVFAALAGGVAARASDVPVPGAGAVAKVVSCDVTSATRSATFYARMDAIPDAARLALRFQLFERLGRDQPWARLDLPGLRQWHGSQAGVMRFGWKQTVGNLHIGGAYKARVHYRWLAADGSVIETAVRETTVCRGPLPNLTVGDLSVAPGPTDSTRTYRVAVHNTGKADAASVQVALTVDNAILDMATVSHLAAGEVRIVSFTGPPCRMSIRVTADPGNSIGETVKDDNSQLFACP